MTGKIIIATLITCVAFAQDVQTAPTPAQGPEGKAAPPAMRQGPRRGHQGQRNPRLNPGMMLLGEQLVIEKYDADKDGKLSPEEVKVVKEAVKKATEDKKAAFVKKYDKDGDGKLSEEEKKAMREEWMKDHPEVAKRVEEMKAKADAKKAEALKKYDTDGDGKLSDEEKKAMHEEWMKDHPMAAKREEARKQRHEKMLKDLDKDGDGKLSESELQNMKPIHGARGPQNGPRPGMGHGPQRAPHPGMNRGPQNGGPNGPRPGMHGGPQGPRGPQHGMHHGPQGGPGNHRDHHNRHGQASRPVINKEQSPLTVAGWMLLEEKYDANKDGILDENEQKNLKTDAHKAIEAKRAQIKAAREAKKAKAENNRQ